MIKIFFLIIFLFSGVINSGELSKKKQGIALSYGLMGGAAVSYFDKERNSEVFGAVMNFSDDTYESDYDANKKQSELHISLHYRKFFKERVGGYYYGGFARYSKLEGKLKNEHSRATQSKVGIGTEVGYTSFGLLNYPSLYWSTGLGIGVYLSGEHEIFEDDDMLGDIPMVVHLELIRIGFVF